MPTTPHHQHHRLQPQPQPQPNNLWRPAPRHDTSYIGCLIVGLVVFMLVVVSATVAYIFDRNVTQQSISADTILQVQQDARDDPRLHKHLQEISADHKITYGEYADFKSWRRYYESLDDEARAKDLLR